MANKDIQSELPREEPVPIVITEEFFKIVSSRTDRLIRDLREKEFYQEAIGVIRLMTVCENLQLNLKDERKKIEDLLEHHVDATGRIEEAVKISQRDRGTIDKLQEEVKEAWAIADASKTRELHAQEGLRNMHENYTNATKAMKKYKKQLDDSELAVMGEDHKTKILREMENLISEVDDLKKRLQLQRSYSEQIQLKCEKAEKKNRELFHQWDESTNENLIGKNKLTLLTTKVEQMEDELEKVTDNMLHYRNQAETRHKRLKDQDKQLSDMRDNMELLRNDNDVLKNMRTKLQMSIENYKQEITNVNYEVINLKNFLRLKEEESHKITSENERLEKKTENFVRKIASIERIAHKFEQESILQRDAMITIEKEHDSIRRKNDILENVIVKSNKKIEHQFRDLERQNKSIIELKEIRLQLDQRKLQLEADLKNSTESKKKAIRLSKQVELKLEAMELERLDLQQNIQELSDDSDAKNKQISSLTAELNTVKKQHDQFKIKRNSLLKQLHDSGEELQMYRERVNDFNGRLTISQNQNDAANSLIASKIQEIENLLKRKKKIENLNRNLKRILQKRVAIIKKYQLDIKDAAIENKKLKQALYGNDESLLKMRNNIDKVIYERNIVASQMIRRTDINELQTREIASLKQVIEQGNKAYNERMNDVKLLKEEIKCLRSQRNALKRSMVNTADMRHEIFQLHHKLNQERAKSKVFELEMVKPINVHRWRKLKIRDPKQMELLKKYQRLQRKLLMQTSRLFRSEEIIQILNERIKSMETKIDKKQSLLVQKKLLFVRSQLNQCTKSMKAAIAISRSNECDLKLKEQSISNLQRDLNEAKSQLFNEKKEKFKLQKLRHMKMPQDTKDKKEQISDNKEIKISNLFVKPM